MASASNTTKSTSASLVALKQIRAAMKASADRAAQENLLQQIGDRLDDLRYIAEHEKDLSALVQMAGSLLSLAIAHESNQRAA